MPLVSYRIPPSHVNGVIEQPITKMMPTPKQITKIEAWFKGARQVIQTIPNPDTTDWVIKKHIAGINAIEFLLQNTLGQQCIVSIDRTKKF